MRIGDFISSALDYLLDERTDFCTEPRLEVLPDFFDLMPLFLAESVPNSSSDIESMLSNSPNFEALGKFSTAYVALLRAF